MSEKYLNKISLNVQNFVASINTCTKYWTIWVWNVKKSAAVSGCLLKILIEITYFRILPHFFKAKLKQFCKKPLKNKNLNWIHTIKGKFSVSYSLDTFLQNCCLIKVNPKLRTDMTYASLNRVNSLFPDYLKQSKQEMAQDKHMISKLTK